MSSAISTQKPVEPPSASKTSSSHLERPPGPDAGNLTRIKTLLGFLGDPLEFVNGRFNKYGDLYYVPNKQGGFYVMKHPDHVHAVLVKEAAKMRKEHTAFELLSKVVGEGLLTTDGDVWRRQRRMLQPAFSQARLQTYADAMTSEAARVRDALRSNETVDMSRAMMELTLRVVCRTLFSHDVSGETDDVARAMTVLQDSVSRAELIPEWIPTPHRRRFRESIAAIDRIVYSMIAERRSSAEKNDLLQSLVTAVDDETGGKLSEKEMRDQLVTLFLAGHETTSHALTWTWYLLSQNPEVEAKLHAEVDALGDRLPTFNDPLPYTEQVIKESMRMYPPVYMLARRTAEEVSVGGYTIPPKTEIVLWVYMTHHDPRWYPDPLVFKPERFTPENEQKLPKGAYVPFGAGPRVCIGKTFAMMEAKLLLATIAQRYRMKLAPGHRVAMKPRVTLNPKFGMKMITVDRRADRS